MISIVFVCLGNICRSPLAEGIFKKMLHDEGLTTKFYVDSAGTSAYHLGDQPDYRSCQVAEKHGITLSHEAKQLSFSDLHTFHYIIAMDNNNYRGIKALGEAKGQVILMRDFDTQEQGKDVPDPYYGGIEGFEDVYQICYRSCKNLLEYIKKEQEL